ncbi:hypothetical protein IFM89_000254 [Coptis chinensis]|nr:hypothetical protein IFM89_000254 [Coptis chinensis]
MTELSPEMVSLLHCLHEKGYLKNANFMQSNKFDLSCSSTYYSRTFLQGAAEKFGKDHQELLANDTLVDIEKNAFNSPFESVSSPSKLASQITSSVRLEENKNRLLSEEDVKRLLLFGCPSVTKKSAFAAKRLRSYFNIRETMVCRPCKLNNVCEFANHIVGKKADEMNVGDLMRSLTSYGFGLTHSNLIVPDEIKDSVSNLLKQVVTHSQ